MPLNDTHSQLTLLRAAFGPPTSMTEPQLSYLEHHCHSNTGDVHASQHQHCSRHRGDLHEKAVAVRLRTAEEADHVLVTSQNCSIFELPETGLGFNALGVVVGEVRNVSGDQSLQPRVNPSLHRHTTNHSSAGTAPSPRKTRAFPAPPPNEAAPMANS